jgi:tetratricopeptide (TPR) repeat protein
MGRPRAIMIATILSFVPALAAAQPKPTEKEKKKASELVKKAIAKSQAGDHDTAVELYLEAYDVIPQPLLLSNIGSEYQQMKKPVEALKYFCKYLEADKTGSNVSYVTAQAKALQMELGNDVDDSDVCTPKKKPPPPAKIGDPATGPDTGPPIGTIGGPGPEGGSDGGKRGGTVRLIGYGVTALGVGVLGGGVYFGLEAKKISDEITNHDPATPWPGNIKDREQAGRDAEKKQIIFMVGGGAALAAGVVMILVGGPKTATEVAIRPTVTPESMGLAISGGF